MRPTRREVRCTDAVHRRSRSTESDRNAHPTDRPSTARISRGQVRSLSARLRFATRPCVFSWTKRSFYLMGVRSVGTYAVKLERSQRLVLPRHAEAPADQDFEEWCAAEERSGQPLAVDLFSGAGGLGAGVEDAGWTVVAAVDHDAAALQTHRANFRGQALNVDMSDAIAVERLINKLESVNIDLIAGGPPCQPFSRAGRAKIKSLVDNGRRDAVDTRKELWRSYIDVVTAIKPRAVIMENVPDMAISDDLGVVREIAEVLERAGYYVDYRLLDAWRYGVPQHRKRFILQARRDNRVISWPTPDEKKVTVADAIADLPKLEGTTGARVMPYAGVPRSELAKSLRGDGGSEVIYDHMTRPVREDDRQAFELMDSKTLYSDLPDHLRRYRSDTFDDKYKRLGWMELSRTITAHIAKDGYWYIHPSEHRTLSVREAARIQTFPDSFRFAGTRSDAFRQIGNAVPPALGRAVATAIAADSSTEEQETCSTGALRNALETWALERRKHNWWLFPGPAMTPIAAIFCAALRVHQLPATTARTAVEWLEGVTSVDGRLADGVNASALTPAREKTANVILERLMRLRDVDKVSEELGLAQLSHYAMLCGNPVLISTERTRPMVQTLMDLPPESTGPGSDIKVALAQLVGSGKAAALRMAAIRALTLDDARALRQSVKP